MTDLLCPCDPLVEFIEQPDGSSRHGFGGDVSNVVIAAARQGTTVAIFTEIDDNPFGQDLFEHSPREGVDVSNVCMLLAADTGLYFVHHDEKGRNFGYRREDSACSRMTAADLPVAAVTGTRVLYGSGNSLAARAVTHEAMRFCDNALSGLNDARRITGLPSADEIIDVYHDLSAETVALTLGQDGVAMPSDRCISMTSHLIKQPKSRISALRSPQGGMALSRRSRNHLK